VPNERNKSRVALTRRKKFGVDLAALFLALLFFLALGGDTTLGKKHGPMLALDVWEKKHDTTSDRLHIAPESTRQQAESKRHVHKSTERAIYFFPTVCLPQLLFFSVAQHC
jgi:hypothetical protein